MDQPLTNATNEKPEPEKCSDLGRKFGVLDAMILVAAAAVAAMSIGPFLRYGYSIPEFFDEFLPTAGRLSYAAYLDTIVKFLGPWTASLTLAFLAIRLRGPRPTLHRLMRQPGMVACVAASFLLVLEATTSVIVFAILGLPNMENFYFKYLSVFMLYASVAVVAAWVSLLFAGRWKSEPGWIDRMGRLIGVIWLTIFLLNIIFESLFPMMQIKYGPQIPPSFLSDKEDREREAMEQRSRDLEVKKLDEEFDVLQRRLRDLEQRNGATEKELRALEQKK